MDFIDKVKRMKGIGLAGPSGRSPYIEASHGSGGAKDHSASCGGYSVLSVADLKTWHISYGVVHVAPSLWHEYSKEFQGSKVQGASKRLPNLESSNPKILEPHIKFMYLFLHLSRREVKLLRNTHKLPMANSPLAKLPSEGEMVGDRKLKSEIKELLSPGVCLRVKEGKKKA